MKKEINSLIQKNSILQAKLSITCDCLQEEINKNWINEKSKNNVTRIKRS